MGPVTHLGDLPAADQAAVVDLVAAAIGARRLLHFGTLAERETMVAAGVIQRLADYGAAWDMDGDHLRVTGWARPRETR